MKRDIAEIKSQMEENYWEIEKKLNKRVSLSMFEAF